MMGTDEPPHISVAAGIAVGLASSFVQSLGLTIQRKSHLQNEALPLSKRKKDHKRGLWVVGFLIFICSNLLGTIFQIGALPIVVLGPLGAVSLLYNAFFAKIILGDSFSFHLVIGTILIAGGAVLIGIFGVVPEVTHSLDELVALYARPAFMIWMAILAVAITVVVTSAHLSEWAFDRKFANTSASPLADDGPSSPSPKDKAPALWRRRSRRWSAPAPVPSPLRYEHHQHERQGLLPSDGATNGLYGATTTMDEEEPAAAKRKRSFRDFFKRTHSQASTTTEEGEESEEGTAFSPEMIERTKLLLGVGYGAASGTLSGLCLLFAKTGIELLILTVIGKNQFGHFEAWLIILALLVAAVLQLFYLNRALKHLAPTLTCPLAFCFYNLSSIISGVIYYDQVAQMTWLQVGLVTLGTAVLLGGVWVVSLQAGETVPDKGIVPVDGALVDEPDSFEPSSDEDDAPTWKPYGLSIGIGAASPGFALRPTGRRAHTSAMPSSATFSSFSDTLDIENRPLLVERTASETDAHLGGSADRVRSQERRHRRGFSISGSLYVGHREGGGGRRATSGEVSPRGDDGSESPTASPRRTPRRASRLVMLPSS